MTADEARSASRVQVLVLSVAVVLVGTLVAALIVYIQSDDPELARLDLENLPTGPSAQIANGYAVIVNRTDTGIVVFVGGTPREELISLCEPTDTRAEQLFVEPQGRTIFDLQGHRLSGPAVRDLDRYGSSVEGGHLVIDTTDIRIGAALDDVGSMTAAFEPRLDLEVWQQIFEDSNWCPP